jgi:hypothetical protein
MLKLKEEWVDGKICCPFTRKEILCRFIPQEMYMAYSNKGYDYMFQLDEPIIEEEPIKKSKKQDDISE